MTEDKKAKTKILFKEFTGLETIKVFQLSIMVLTQGLIQEGRGLAIDEAMAEFGDLAKDEKIKKVREYLDNFDIEIDEMKHALKFGYIIQGEANIPLDFLANDLPATKILDALARVIVEALEVASASMDFI